MIQSGMSQTGKLHRDDLDLLKGFAIIAVVLYHMGISQYGYLGVDVFFAINGFLIMPKVIREVADGCFHYGSFLEKRIVRLLPLLLLASACALLVGYWGMLPDDYENLSTSVVATSFFSNNILSAITTANYWDVVNDYKALMHTWYIGILFEFYLILPLVVLLVKGLSCRCRLSFYKAITLTITGLTMVSLLCYLDPSATVGDRFYLLHYRFFELACGGLAGLWISNSRQSQLYGNRLFSAAVLILLVLVINSAVSIFSKVVLLPLTVVLTTLLLLSDNSQSRLFVILIRLKVICLLGVMSYSIFIWHQPVLAFYRYFVSDEMTPQFVLLFLIVVFLLSYLTYLFIEQKVRVSLRTRVIILAAFLLVNAAAFAIYLHAGVVRDVPELYVSMDNVHRNMHAEYVDRIYPYDKDFPTDNGKLNVLVVGNSFARDWANILLESEMADRINLSYIFQDGEQHIDKQYIRRIRQADYIFFHGWKHFVPAYVWQSLKPGAEVWGIGTKNFGQSNGIIYKNRFRPDYFQQTIKVKPYFIRVNNQMKAEWQDKYIDLLTPAMIGNDDRVAVFTHDKKFISQDTRHLTKGGAEFYAKKLDFRNIFPND